MKYLNLNLDGKWSFKRHFTAVAERTSIRANILGHLMPNIGGPSGRVRRLYANTVSVVIRYGLVGRRFGDLPAFVHEDGRAT